MKDDRITEQMGKLRQKVVNLSFI